MNETASTMPNHERYLLGIPLVATVLIWLWVGSMNLLQSPGSSLMLIVLLTTCSTAALAALEVGKRSTPGAATRTPRTWFFMIALLWVVAYPMYMLQRRQFGLPNRLLPSCIVALVFCVSWFLMSSSIEARKSEVRQNFEELRSRLSQPAR